MLIGGGKHFVIEIVKQPHQSPLIFVIASLAVSLNRSSHSGLHGQRMFPQAFALGVFTKQFPGFGSIRHRGVALAEFFFGASKTSMTD
jgi:hypothetical protein